MTHPHSDAATEWARKNLAVMHAGTEWYPSTPEVLTSMLRAAFLAGTNHAARVTLETLRNKETS